MVFEKTLTDIVKGIRASKRDTALYISSCVAEIKTEINSTDMYTKTNALQKLTFLQMMGYHMSWAAFATIEVMSDPRFGHKRIGYLAASQAFTQSTDVVLLTTNTLKKELRGVIGGGMTGVYEAGLAINCLSNIVTEDLARELLQDVTNLTSHPQPYLRKKAVLCLLKLFVKYPQGLRLTFHRIQHCLLKDSNPSVTSCAVNVITELSDKNPRNYLVLAPSFFSLLTNSTNNWMLIKVVKLLGSLVPEEPRLARKLLEPLAHIVRSTQAKSLLYESVFTITRSLPYCRKSDGSMPANMPSIVELCAETLRSLLKETDQNLKYLGLVGFGSLMASYPKVLTGANYRGLVLACLSNDDVTIRTRALDLLTGVATRKNVRELVTQLLGHVEGSGREVKYRDDLVRKIVEICSNDRYAVLEDFEWYLDVLVGLARCMGGKTRNTGGGSGGVEKVEDLGTLISGQVMDVSLRVLPARAYAVRRMIVVLLEGGSGGNVSIVPELLPAAAWIVGEYSSLIDEALQIDDTNSTIPQDTSSEGTYHAVVQALTDPSNVESIASTTQTVYVQAAMKVLAAASSSSSCSDSELETIIRTLERHLPVFMQSVNLEIQERSFTLFHLLQSLGLTTAPSPIPLQVGDGVVNSDTDHSDTDHDSSSGEEDGGNIAKGHNVDDLLGFTMGVDSSKLSSSKNTIMSTDKTMSNISKSSKSLASNCRASSSTLRYLLIPELMKPISAKAQRKKRQSAPPQIKAMLEAPVNLSVFTKMLITNENDGTSSSWKKKVHDIEAVTFTQQKPMETSKNMRQFGSGATLIGIGGQTATGASQNALSSQPQTTNAEGNLNISLNAKKEGDPFYLNSSGAVGTGSSTGPGNRFGTIQLLDSDDDDNDDDYNGRSGSRKKKKRKEKKRNKNKMSDSDFMLLGSDFGAGGKHNASNSSSRANRVYVSDDDDENISNFGTYAPSSAATKTKPNLKGFEGLAKVDLTTPLGPDEVIPVARHRIVPTVEQKGKKKNKKNKISIDTKANEQQISSHGDAINAELNGFGGVKKHSKRKKKKDKQKHNHLSSFKENGTKGYSEAPHVMNATEDLLNITGLVSSSNNSKVNEAFDDLLELRTLGTSSVQQKQIDSTAPPSITPSVNTSKRTNSLQAWQLGSIKYSKASGGNGIMDWSQVQLSYRTYVLKKKKRGGGDGLSVRFRLVNRTSDTVLVNCHIDLKGDTCNGRISFQDAEPGTAAESEKLSLNLDVEVSQALSPEIRGVLSVSGWEVPISISLPSTASLSPISNLTQDQAGSMLSEGKWTSFTAKVDSSNENDPSKLKAALKSFLRAAEVEPDQKNITSGIFAMQSESGAKVLVLVKIAGQLKFDLKSTDKKLAKALMSDLKRLVFKG